MMSKKVLITQSDESVITTFATFFTERGYSIFTSSNKQQASEQLDANPDIELAIIDLHLQNNDWEYLIAKIKNNHPDIRVICTNNYPVLQREYRVQELGVSVFLRKPFTDKWIENALDKTEAVEESSSNSIDSDDDLPEVTIPVRMKITFPYALLALLLAMGAAYVVSQIVLESVESRFRAQLVEAGVLSADWVVAEEKRLLADLRLISHTNGVRDTILTQNSETAREIILPLAINNKQEAIDLLDLNGKSILSLHHNSSGDWTDFTDNRGEEIFAEWSFVQKVLAQESDSNGDKFGGIVNAPWGAYLYIAGPLFDESGEMIGVILVGSSLNTITKEMQEEILARVTFYDLTGQPISIGFFQDTIPPLTPEEQARILLNQEDQAHIRLLTDVGTADYSEIIGPLELRGGQDFGFIGSAKAQTLLVQTSAFTQIQIFVFVTLAFLFIVLIGVYLANRITQPLIRMMEASQQVAKGNLSVSVNPNGNDEVAVLGHSFNRMVSGLREGSMYRDLLGRTVSLEVREQMRNSFSSGELLLEGQEALATVIMSDIRGFTTMSESYEPTVILAWLNEFFGEIVPIINGYGGVVNKFEGDAVMAFFGIIPRKLPTKESATLGCRVAVEMLEKIEALNEIRIARGDPPFIAGIGVHTGNVTAGGLGASDRLHYTIIGDTVNTTARLETFTRQLTDECCIVISDATKDALEERASDFKFQPVGQHIFKGKTIPMQVYRLWTDNFDMTNLPEAVFKPHEVVTHATK